MKRFILLLLIMSLMLSAFGCAREQEPDEEVVDIEVEKPQEETEKEPQEETEKQPEKQEEKPKEDAPQTQETPQKQETPQVQETPKPQTPTQTAPATAPDYKSFDCRKDSAIKWKQVRFTNEKNVTLHLEIPSDWEIKEVSGGYTVLRGGKQIGNIAFDKPTGIKRFYEYNSDYNEKYQILKSYQVNWLGTDTVDRCYEFVTDQGTKNVRICLSVDYKELDNTASERLMGSALTVPRIIDNFPRLETSNGSKKILLLGNSFINSSRINVFLSDMLAGTGYTLVSVARGYAEVHKYALDTVICDQIKNGEYSYVFMCGYYGAANVDATKTFLDICAVSGTNYVIFPAHNEGNNYIDQTIAAYGEIPVLSWKNELDSLISGGIDRYSLCYDDGGYEHSNLYAGYVGAHMIYRSLFQKLPPKLSVTAPLIQSQVDGVLGDYAYSMHVPELEQISFNGTEYKIK